MDPPAIDPSHFTGGGATRKFHGLNKMHINVHTFKLISYNSLFITHIT